MKAETRTDRLTELEYQVEKANLDHAYAYGMVTSQEYRERLAKLEAGRKA